jgi:hypothetical protein
MSAFQILALAVIAGLLGRDFVTWSRSQASLRVRIVRCFIWVGAAVAIAIPGLVQTVAEMLGIGRGADVVLYLSVLGFLWVAFFLYARCLRLERELTALTRHLAIRDATRLTRNGVERATRPGA